ncbi:rhodanese-like domain-containing protein [Sporosarcina pasteurii]|uniref:Probable adenylyltransferase/sulfurtransferase MoeZ n=1 Tax=Sporosarcina pasteurii TaxID=1474 RepID=A0A380CEK8_SPOPA|nr:rhodanese-like domain-containing protein [Sporosarcina pasteurii]MDS9473191.1 rhodanese-like domain-containing protein [Sporosarcina pasteurii]QBQ06924.1 rhodanese-like domain-containing protein [Sporosarcina pasteurii]SUJ18955.1 Probable adenylyltransferase/sulfurtransferase MoeZ [Sporosarcina pasteurii]
MKEISTKEVLEKLNNGEKLNMIDVREADEVAHGMVPGAKHIPLGDIPNRLDEIDKDHQYVMICRSGGRSGNACNFLSEQGYDVMNMTGGMLDWEGEVEK